MDVPSTSRKCLNKVSRKRLAESKDKPSGPGVKLSSGRRYVESRYRQSYVKKNGQLGEAKTSADLRKKKETARNQADSSGGEEEYTRSGVVALCRRFYEEEEEPEDPQLLNTKLIYKYLLDCMSGQAPPHLPPKENAVVLSLLKLPKENEKYDFKEELDLLRNPKKAKPASSTIRV